MYKKITQSQFLQLDVKTYHRKGQELTKEFWEALDSLEVGQGFVVHKNEWHRKSSPGAMYQTNPMKDAHKESGKRIIFRTLLDDSGWGCQRIA